MHGEIEIGNHVMFGPGVHIHGGNHIFDRVGQYMDQVVKDGSDGKIIIDDDVWIGANAIILKGVRVGEGSIVGAGAVVTKDVAPYTIVAGNPAKKIRDRFSPELIEEHRSIISDDKKII